MRYQVKAIWSGDVVEIFQYEFPVKVGEDNCRPGRSAEATEERKVLNRLKTMRRARSNLMRLINANVRRWHDDSGRPYEPVFLTLTFRENLRDIDKGNRAFRNFIRRFEYDTGLKLKYVCVIEFQRRGAIHYHLVIFNLPFIPVERIAKIWRHGFVKVNVIHEVDNVGAYMAKYMGKDVMDERLKGEKSYFSSRGLHKPKEMVLSQKELDQLRAGLKDRLVYEAQYKSDCNGDVLYSQYNLKREKNHFEGVFDGQAVLRL